MPRFHAVVFDLDGTLLDSLQDIAAAANDALHACGFPIHPLAHYRRFVGNGQRTLVQRILPPQARSNAWIETVLKRMQDEYARNWRTHTQPYAGIVAMLEKLRLSSVQMAVLSNKPQEFLLSQVSWFFPQIPFFAVAGAREGYALKPDPAAFLDLLNTVGCTPAAAIMVGDTSVDMQTARACGAAALGVLWGFRERSELQMAGADFLAAVPAEITAFIEATPD